MDLLNRAMAQLNDLFRSMSAGTRMTAALLLIVVVVSLGYLFQSRTAGPDSYLLGGHPFSPGEMPAVLGALAQAGLGDFEVEGNLIRIPKAKQSAYLAALADANRLPISFGDRLIDVVERQSPFSSGKQQEAILKQALNSMLAKSISQMAGIESADVYTDTKEKRGFKSEPQATAAVHVRTLGSQPLTAAQAFAIRSLVAGAILGLSRDQVSVIDAHHGKTFSGDGESGGGGGGFDHPYLSLKRTYEQEFQDDIASLLSYVPGVNVSVNVELSKMQHSEEESQKFDPKPVAMRTTSDETETSTDSGGPGGRPGLEAQQPNRGASIAGAGRGNSSRETRNRSEESKVTSTDITRSRHVGLTPERVSVSVAIPSSYFVNLWRERHPTVEGQTPVEPTTAELVQIEEEEREKIRKLVFNKIPHQADLSAADLVSVAPFTPIPLAPSTGPGMSTKALAWLGDSWSTLGMFALAGVSLVMLRSVVRGVPNQASPWPAAGHEENPAVLPMAANPIETGEAASAKSRLRRRASTGPSLRDDLVELVREDPDAAANILKGWIGNLN